MYLILLEYYFEKRTRLFLYFVLNHFFADLKNESLLSVKNEFSRIYFVNL